MAGAVRNPLIVVLGATGTGKSQLAVDVALQFNGEIINVDAMQMYGGLPIITNKVSTEEQKGVPHHLLGTVSLDEEPWRVDKFMQHAGRVIQEIRSRGRLPVLVGGTHYYTQSLLFPERLVAEAAPQEEVRDSPDGAEVFPILEEPTDVILRRLREVDPVMADRWHPNDRRKIQRSLQVYLQTGQKASDIYLAQQEKQEDQNAGHREDEPGPRVVDPASALLFWVHADSEKLKARLDGRVDKMVDAGLMAEVESLDRILEDLKGRGTAVDTTRGIWVSIGWKEFEPYLQAVREGALSQEELESLRLASLEKVKAATRQYARNQIRWIRIKLVHALSKADILNHLFVLDGTDVAAWEANVSEVAIKISKQFLCGDELPDPKLVFAKAEELLVPKQSFTLGDRRDLWLRRECDVCRMTAVTEVDWDKHINSRRHRRAVKKASKQRPDSESGESPNCTQEDF